MISIIVSLILLTAAEDTKDVSFLVGCWEKSEAGETIKEVWSARGSVFRGHGETFKRDRLVFWENISIFYDSKNWIYQPAPMGKNSVSFAYQNCSTTEILCANFVNLKHDFPQQIRYSQNKKNKNTLDIQLAGKGKPRAYALSSVKCETTSPK